MKKRLKAALKAFMDPKIIEPKIDELTGALTRDTFIRVANREYNRAQRLKQELILIFIDLDGLKRINDTYGHRKGDNSLKEFTKTTFEHIRSIDILARMGGDEFALLLLSTTEEGAKNTIERIQESFPHFSWGISVWNKNDELSVVLNKADKKMYEMKNNIKPVLD